MHPTVVAVVAPSDVKDQTPIAFGKPGDLWPDRHHLSGRLVARDAAKVSFVVSSPRRGWRSVDAVELQMISALSLHVVSDEDPHPMRKLRMPSS